MSPSLLAGRRIYITHVHSRHLTEERSAFDIKIDGQSRPVLDALEYGMTLIPRPLRHTQIRRDPPVRIEIGRPGGPALLVLRGGADLFHPNLEMSDTNGRFLGSFSASVFAIGVKYAVRDSDRRRRWLFRSGFAARRWTFLDGNRELARVSGGRIDVALSVAPGDPVRPYLLVSGFMAIVWRALQRHE